MILCSESCNIYMCVCVPACACVRVNLVLNFCDLIGHVDQADAVSLSILEM